MVCNYSIRANIVPGQAMSDILPGIRFLVVISNREIDWFQGSIVGTHAMADTEIAAAVVKQPVALDQEIANLNVLMGF